MTEERAMLRRRIKAWALLLAMVFLLPAGGRGEIVLEPLLEPIALYGFEMSVEPGYDGKITYNKTFPVRVRIINHGTDFEGTLAMNAYISRREYDRYEQSITLPAGAEREYILPLKIGIRQESFTAELLKDGKVVSTAEARPLAAINPSAMLIGVLSTRPQNLSCLDITKENDPLSRSEYWQTVPLTPESFPDTAEMMQSFGMLVVDDISPAELTQKQQDVLDEWLCGGRILLTGAGAQAAKTLPAFSRYTELTAGGVTLSDRVLSGLRDAVGVSREEGEPVLLTARISAEYSPLAADDKGQGLLWRASAGAGRIYTAAFEIGDPELNANPFMHSFWQRLLIQQDYNLYSRVMYTARDDLQPAPYMGYQVSLPADSGLLTCLLLLGAGLVLGCALWLILKRRDRSQGMWAVLPVLFIAECAGIFMLSRGAETNRPMAAASTLLTQEDGIWNRYTSIHAALPEAGLHTFGLEDGNLHMVQDESYYYDDPETKGAAPDSLRMIYRQGEKSEVSRNLSSPWKMLSMYTLDKAEITGKAEASAWMEEDGLHGEIINGTGMALQPGWVITSYGYKSIPALKPGEKADFVMRFAEMDKSKGFVTFQDGSFYLSRPWDIYQIIGQAVPVHWNTPKEQEDSALNSLISSAVQVWQSLDQQRSEWYDNTLPFFTYAAVPEEEYPLRLKVDGKAVEQKRNMTAVTVRMSMLPVGKTGLVFCPADTVSPVLCEVNDMGWPAGDVEKPNGQSYYDLTQNPTFRFTLDMEKKVQLTRMIVVMEDYYTYAEPMAFNHRKYRWEKIPVNAEAEHPERYMDENGNIYIQLRPANGEAYYGMDIPAPQITLEGRVEDAEN